MIDTDSVKSQLEQMRADCLSRHERFDAHMKRAGGPLAQDFAEQAVERQNDEVIGNLDEIATATLPRIDAALRRIGDGRFGECTDCGEAIEPGRLEVIPYAETCIGCAEKREQNAG
ncbi:MAG: TraR/DksA family transcriptional regulator [Gammaproteobacteria bacterium]|nr:TraR/DksA family transcriptional regulator [Gammaproteobacteria bacterium]NNL99863.1 TraR/DksA family transcriptional regulator [Gammaproteobacteria bacterium]